ncbi:ATP-binding cassette domain-containing protein [Salibacterium salarium]|uniref:ATP-binding cassette domain-containing protein n=1 Tax=Salibacterium salarium TaxID=284579 RepID=A0A428N4X0_9BACI|nr:ATP-binding cassette domain-containing protein [Salibacterium salarium]RSL33287.1 ATP-binding cassette domain-containing protein [Salibacterium salarium]
MDNETLLEFQNVDVITAGDPRLKNISLDIKKGEQWGLLGLNGSGKTTLLQIIAGYVWPTSGTLYSWKGKYGQINIPQLRQSIGWVSDALDDRYRTRQSDSAIEVVLSGLFASVGLYDTTSRDEVSQAEKWMQFFGIEDLKNKRYSQLSQGEKKRTMLARAWIAEPQLLLLDEPCTGLDVKGREEFLLSLEALMKLENAPALIYVTHHIEELPTSVHNVLLLKDGQMLHKGPKLDVLTDENVQQTFDVNAKVHWEKDRPWLVVKN